MMPISGKVSIVVPCYNQDMYMEEALDSVLAQTYTNWECLLVNDGSTDNTEKIARNYCSRDSRFVYLEKKNGGLSSARNFGIGHATGDYIQFFDADDVLPPSKLECHLECFAQNPEADIVYGKNRRFYNDDLNNWEYPRLRFELKNYDTKDMFHRVIQDNVFVVHSALIRKSVTDKAGFFDEGLRCMEDWDYWIRCSLLNLVFFYCPDVRGDAWYRIKAQSMSTNQWNMKIANSIIFTRYYRLIRDKQVYAAIYRRLKDMRRELINLLYLNRRDKEIFNRYYNDYARKEVSGQGVLSYLRSGPGRILIVTAMANWYRGNRFIIRQFAPLSSK